MKQRSNSKGFTIIELLISTVIFAVILLLVTGAIVQFSRTYYKGIIQSRTQDVSRAISQDLAQNVQFSRGDPKTAQQESSPVWVTCVGNMRYTYVKGEEVGGVYKHGLVSDTPFGGCNPDIAFNMFSIGLPFGTREYLGEKMQLLKLDFTKKSSGLHEITVQVAYGNDDDLNATKTACKPVIQGGQFCAISSLTTTVTQRLK